MPLFPKSMAVSNQTIIQMISRALLEIGDPVFKWERQLLFKILFE